MAWKTVEVHPATEKPAPAGPARSLSPPLMRICGFLGFFGVGFLVLRVSGAVLGLAPGFWEAGDWGFRETAAIGFAGLASFLGGLFGAGAGLKLEVTSPWLNRLLAILWHFVANGQIVCLGLLGMVLARKQRVATMPEALRVFGLAAAACVLIAAILFLLAQFRADERPNLLLCSLVAVPLTVALAFDQAKIFLLDRGMAITIGVAYGLMLVLLSAFTIRRDYDQLAQLRGIQKRG